MRNILSTCLLVFCFQNAWGEEAKIQKWNVVLENSHSSGLIKVCLYRDKTTAGLFSQGDWKASIESNSSIECEEALNADLELRNLYLYYGVAGAKYRCDANRQQSKYGCSSAFVVQAGTVSQERIDDIIKESSLIALLEEQIPKVQRAKEAAKRAAYLQAYEHAITLESIQQFETTYAGSDSNGLIAKLADKKALLELQKYRGRFTSAKTSKDYSLFIADYETKDTDNLVPEARRKLSEAEKLETAERDTALQKVEADRRQSELNKLERQIAWCKNQSTMAQKAINRENEIGTVSGYVNKNKLHQAGETIVSCKDSITKIYAEYRQQGGAKSLAAIE